MPTTIDTAFLQNVLSECAVLAAERILKDWRGPKTVTRKADGSPVTQTDADAESLITTKLRAACPYPIVAEEEFERGETPDIDPEAPFFLIDALDGTRDFINDGPDFTVNIALIDKRVPVLGIICAPALGVTWHAAAGRGAYSVRGTEITKMEMRERPQEGVFLLGGKRSSEPVVIEPFIGTHAVAGREQRSSSLKFCLLAEGQADLYPRLVDTYEWDTAAGDIILREAGGAVLDLATGRPLVYGKKEKRFLNGGFIAGKRQLFLPTISIPPSP